MKIKETNKGITIKNLDLDEYSLLESLVKHVRLGVEGNWASDAAFKLCSAFEAAAIDGAEYITLSATHEDLPTDVLVVIEHPTIETYVD